MGRAGLELFSEKSSQGHKNKGFTANTPNTPQSKRVHDPVHETTKCPELQKIIEAWPSLSTEQKQRIIKIIEGG